MLKNKEKWTTRIHQNGTRFFEKFPCKIGKACYTTQNHKEMLHCLGIFRKVRIVDSQNYLSQSFPTG